MADMNFTDSDGDGDGGDGTRAAVSRTKRTATRLNNRVKDATADVGRSVSRYVRDNGPREMFDDVTGLVKKHPGKSMIVVAALAFLIGRAMVGSRRVETSAYRRREATD